METELDRLAAESRREPDANWKRWGPYLAERQWGTVREYYSEDGQPWQHFTYKDAIWRAYRWGEDGLLSPLLCPGDLETALTRFSRSDYSASPGPKAIMART